MNGKEIPLINDSNSVLALSVLETTHMPMSCHGDLEFVYVLWNSLKVRLLSRTVILAPDDILLINSNELHELSSVNVPQPCMFISLHIKINLLDPKLVKGLHFHFDSTFTKNKMKFYLTKHCIAELVKLYTTDNKLTPFFSRSIAYLFLNELAMHFTPDKKRNELSAKHIERFLNISAYINDNWEKNLSLGDVANTAGLSPQYVSQFFKRQVGINFLDYYNDIRLSRAVNELTATNKTVEQIADECGYSESRTFAANFKRKYGCSPLAYRREHTVKPAGTGEISKDDYLILLAKYLPPRYDAQMDGIGITTDVKFVQIYADCGNTPPDGEFLPSFNKYLLLPPEKESMYADVQRLIKIAREELGFETACFTKTDGDAYTSGRITSMLTELGMRTLYLFEENTTVKAKTDALNSLKKDNLPGNDLINDTCFRACSVVRRQLQSAEFIEYFGLVDNPNVELVPFVGGTGLFAFGGIKKPLYHALKLLRRISGSVIVKGDGYLVVKSQTQIQILLYNYEHLSELYLSGKSINDTFFERLGQIDKLSRMSVEVVLNGIFSPNVSVREYILSRKYGSSFDEWLSMGRPTLIDPDIERLKRVCEPKAAIRVMRTEENSLTLEMLLEPLEIRLVEITL
jgi:AraC-like DNA-binding protein